VAFGKLHGVLDSKPLSLPGKNAINLGLAAANLAAGAAFLTTGDPATGVAALGELALPAVRAAAVRAAGTGCMVLVHCIAAAVRAVLGVHTAALLSSWARPAAPFAWAPSWGGNGGGAASRGMPYPFWIHICGGQH
jgi:hypothetical protein